nr:PREDICTED: tripartite motif-containing protein 58-like [Opisthocomus hoazin]
MKTSAAALAVLLVAVLCYQVSSSPSSVNVSGPCCLRYSTKAFPLSRVVMYEHTGSHCVQPAVIFTTVKGRLVCGKPDEQWVQDIVNHQKDKVRLQKSLEHLSKEVEDMKRRESVERMKTQECKAGAWLNASRTSSREISSYGLAWGHEFGTVLRGEKLLLQKLEEEEKQILLMISENLARLVEQKCVLEELILEIKEKTQQPAHGLLKDMKIVLSRCEWIKLQSPKPVSVTLKENYSIPERCLGMRDMLKKFKALSSWSQFAYCRKGNVLFSPNNGYWVLRLQNGGNYEALTAPVSPLTLSVRPRCVGIFLDYEAGEISFYNVSDRSHIYTFTDKFFGNLRPLFFLGGFLGGRNAEPLVISWVRDTQGSGCIIL